MVSYADDFIVTAANKETLEQIVMPELSARLAKVGLENYQRQKPRSPILMKDLTFSDSMYENTRTTNS